MNPKLFEAINEKCISREEIGLPEHYPCPPDTENLLFYIQRNQNLNTVVYELNRLYDGRINEEYPVHVFWLRYSDNGEIQNLNYIQNKLAYGYESKQITPHTFQFELVSYRELKFYIDRIGDNQYGAFTRINGKTSRIVNIYVYAEELGLFPNVKYIELFGFDAKTDEPVYEKIIIGQ